MEETEKSPEYIAEMMGVKPEQTMHVDINSVGVPAAKNWKVGQDVRFTISGKVKSLSIGDSGTVSACVDAESPKSDS